MERAITRKNVGYFGCLYAEHLKARILKRYAHGLVCGFVAAVHSLTDYHGRYARSVHRVKGVFNLADGINQR